MAPGARPDGYDRGQVADQLTSDSPPRFAHESEAELARILDFYGVAWRYEPDVFPISWNADGAVIESFAPDFYLPEIDLYVELTTLKQSLVRKKNRKLRRLRQLYPEIRVKLFYARDFRALMVKYGRTGLPGRSRRRQRQRQRGTAQRRSQQRPPTRAPSRPPRREPARRRRGDPARLGDGREPRRGARRPARPPTTPGASRCSSAS